MEQTKKQKILEPLKKNGDTKRHKGNSLKENRVPICDCGPVTNKIESQVKYVTHVPGNSPIVITVPHGGTLVPDHIPDRETGCFVPDTNTEELGRAIVQALKIKTKFLPHLVILHLHRKKLDGNRPRRKAAEGDKARLIWDEYHNKIYESIRMSHEQFGFVHVFDVHGQSHREETEIGYGLKNVQLRCFTELEAKKFCKKCSLSGLVRRIEKDCKDENMLTNLIKGPKSFGGLLESYGYPCVPGPKMPHPCSEDSCNNEPLCWKWSGVGEPTDPCTYFWGGFSTAYYGHCFAKKLTASGLPDEVAKTCCCVTQLETAAVPRIDTVSINKFSDAISSSIVDFIQHWYKFDLSPTKLPE